MAMMPGNCALDLGKRISRRHFFSDCRVGLGAMALACLLDRDGARAAEPASVRVLPSSHPRPRPGGAIHLFWAGGPSQLDLFDPKPALRRLDGQEVPKELVADKRYAFIRKDAK